MTVRSPVHGASHQAEPADATAALAALQGASDNPDLPAATRLLLRDACDALVASGHDARSARLRYHALFDAVPDPVSILDEHGIVLDLNKAALASYRRPRREVIGQLLHVLDPELPRDHLAQVREALDRGGTSVVEVSHRREDGSRFPVEVHSAAFRYKGHNCIVMVARDLSARRDAELRYSALMESIDQGILVRDAHGHIVHANAAGLRLFGIAPGQLADLALHLDHWMVIDETGREVTADERPSTRALRSGRPVASTVLGFFHRQRRQLRWLSVSAVPQFARGGERPYQVLSMLSDVTALKRESALLERAQTLSHIGGWEWDTGRNQLHLTAEAQRILGRQPAPQNMQALLACLSEADRPRLQQALDRAMATGQPFDLELQGSRDDHHTFWIRALGEPEIIDPLSARLSGSLQDITERKQTEQTLRVQARTDPLTCLLNRDAVLYELETRLADPTQAALAVLYVDLDRFKIVNDVLGHASGDRLLRQAARRIQRAVGSEGMIARFGGDEFLVICATGDDGDRPQRLAEAILAIFADSFRLDGEEFSVTASVGIALGPADGEHSEALIQSADTAMYASKRRTRNGWQAFTPELAEQQQHRLQLETHLRRAVGNEEFHLVYQPQVELASGRLVAAEALIRWRHESLGEMRPDHFIGHAESSGDIVGIGSWALVEACRQMRQWRDTGLPIQRVAVNVSYRQFLGQDLAGNVGAALAESGLPGAALELEFTERVMIEDEPDTLRTFAQLRDMGVMLTIDDFGEGYSALNYLRRLPIHGLKLSQLFVQGVPGNQSDVAVCQAVSGIAASLGLSLVAEGVESEQQRDFLIKLGVPVGQGFLFAPGLLADDFRQRYGT